MPNYEAARRVMRTLVANVKEQDPAEFCLGIAEILGDGTEVPALGSLAPLASIAKGLKESGDIDVAPNPFFVTHGHDDTTSPKTVSYMKSRALKGVAGGVGSIVGTAVSVSTAGVNVIAAAQHGSSAATTLMHMMKLSQIASRDRWKSSVTIQDWLKTCLSLKTAKLTIQSASLAGDVVPGLSLPVSIGAFVARTSIKLTMGKVAQATAMAIHWRAFQEQAISGGLRLGGGRHVGPASDIFFEIFIKRGLSAALGSYDTPALIREPAGWQALSDKLIMM